MHLEDKASIEPKRESPTTLIGFPLKVVQFFKTIMIVRKDTPLYDWDQSKIGDHGLLGPWTLNVFEVALVAVPATLLVAFMTVAFPSKSVEDSIFGIDSALARFQEQTGDEKAAEETKKHADLERRRHAVVKKYHSKFLPIAQSMVLSFTLVFVSILIRKFSFHHSQRDIEPEQRSRAQYAYLYLNGSYGLLPQTLLALAVAAIGLGPLRLGSLLISSVSPEAEFLSDAGSALLVPFLLWNFWLVFRFIPRRLFEINGYSSTAPSLVFWKKGDVDPNAGPWGIYFWAVLLGGGLVAFALKVFLETLAFRLSRIVATFELGM